MIRDRFLGSQKMMVKQTCISWNKNVFSRFLQPFGYPWETVSGGVSDVRSSTHLLTCDPCRATLLEWDFNCQQPGFASKYLAITT